MNNDDNALDVAFTDKLIKLYERVEEAKEPGVLVTVSMSDKFFSSGFSHGFWSENP